MENFNELALLKAQLKGIKLTDFRPAGGQVALIELPNTTPLRRIGGEVVSFDDGVVKLEVDVYEAAEMNDGWTLVSFPDEMGVIRVEGLLEKTGVPGELILNIKQVHERQQRRSYVRARTQCEVVAVLAGAKLSDVTIINGVTIDLSRGGTRAQLSRPLPQGAVVPLTLLLNGQKVLTIAEVLESTAEGETRFEFKYVAADGIEHIVSRVMSATLSTPGARKLGKSGPKGE